MSFKYTKGQIALPIVLLIGGIVVEIGIIGASFSYILISSGYGERLSAEAWSAAQSGVSDAVLKIFRNKDFTDPGGYQLAVGRRTADVKIQKTADGERKITSTGRALVGRKRLEAWLSINEETGAVSLDSLREIGI